MSPQFFPLHVTFYALHSAGFSLQLYVFGCLDSQLSTIHFLPDPQNPQHFKAFQRSSKKKFIARMVKEAFDDIDFVSAKD